MVVYHIRERGEMGWDRSEYSYLDVDGNVKCDLPEDFFPFCFKKRGRDLFSEYCKKIMVSSILWFIKLCFFLKPNTAKYSKPWYFSETTVFLENFKKNFAAKLSLIKHKKHNQNRG